MLLLINDSNYVSKDNVTLKNIFNELSERCWLEKI